PPGGQPRRSADNSCNGPSCREDHRPTDRPWHSGNRWHEWALSESLRARRDTRLLGASISGHDVEPVAELDEVGLRHVAIVFVIKDRARPRIVSVAESGVVGQVDNAVAV